VDGYVTKDVKGLFLSKNENHKMVLREKHIETNMIGSETKTTYLTQIRQVQDELDAIGEAMDDLELVRMTLKGFTKEWTPFIKGIIVRDKILDWSRFWDDFIQEEIQDEYMNGGSHKNDDENLSLVIQKRRESSRSFPVESLPLKIERRRT
jgi:hypothetical protein